MKLENKVAMVTGATSGIGLAVAKRFALDRCKLVITGRNQEKLESLTNELEPMGVEVLPVRADMTSIDDIKQLFTKTVERFGRIDVVFNNAGLGYINPIYKLTEDEIKQMVNTNVLAMMIVTKYAAEQMIAQKSGHIIITSSIAGLVSTPQWSVYSATKWAVTGLCEGVRYELEDHGIMVTSIHPGPIKTEFFDRAGINRNALGDYKKMTTPEEVAEEVYRITFTKKEKVIVPSSYALLYGMSKFFPFIIKNASRKFAKRNFHINGTR